MVLLMNLYRCTIIAPSYIFNTWVRSASRGEAAMSVLLSYQKELGKKGKNIPFKVEAYLSSNQEAFEYVSYLRAGHLTHRLVS